MKKLFELGVAVTDKITGFSGIVTGHAEYITGCDQYLVQPRVDDDGKHQSGRWFDDARLFKDEASETIEPDTVQGEANGACGVAPIK